MLNKKGKSRPIKTKKNPKAELSRKERRQLERKEKKKKKSEYFSRKKTPKETTEEIQPTEPKKKTKPKENLKKVKVENVLNQEIQRERLKRAKLEKEMKEERKRQLLEANEEEDRNLKTLEKQLKMNKRKSKKVPKSFAEAGLDYILDVCDSEKIQAAVNAEMNLQDSESEFEEDLALITGKNTKKSEKAKEDSESDFGHEDSVSEQISDEEVMNSEDEMSVGSIDADEDEEIKDMDEDEEIKDDETDEKPEVWEDIYGRTRDKKGNVVETTKYVPPHLREKPIGEDLKRKEELERLKKLLKGLLNRLAENNMHGISNQIDELYMKNSRSDMNNIILNLFVESLVLHVHTPERLIMEHAMLLAILHGNVGSEVGAFMLQNLGERFCQMHKKETTVENKELDNLILLICHMYTFKIFDCVLIYDLLNLLCEKFREKDVDLILVVLRSVGFALRKDNPIALKDFILKVQKLANEAKELKEDPRVRFMLEVLLTIKNNNMAKLPQYDPTHSEHLKKIIKTMIRKGNYITELKISLEDLLKADERGRWWVVGSAWSGAPVKQEKKTKTESFSEEVLKLARQQRMNTANRKNIFCILMTAEDYLDAFEKLLRLGLKGQPEQDIVHVLIHCLLRENDYNPYYSYIADQLCISDRRHKMTLQYSLWDRFKELKSLKKHQIANLAKFLSHLFLEKSLPISVLKVLEFTDMDKFCIRLLRQTLLTLLLHNDEELMVSVFAKIANSKKLYTFKESIRLFIHHFLLKNMKESESEEAIRLKERIELVDKALTSFSYTPF